MKQLTMVLILLALCLPASAQERMRSSEGWHVVSAWLKGPDLQTPIVRNDTMFLSWSFDTSRVFIENLITVRADTCRECPEGYELVQFNDGDVCLKAFVTERDMYWHCDPPTGHPYDTTWDVKDMIPVVHPTAIDTTWRLIPEGFEKAEWLKLWAVMHPAPVRASDLVDTLMIWRAVSDVYMDSARVDRFLLEGATIADSISWQDIR